MTKSHVTLEQHICVVCGKTFDTGAILMDTRIDYNYCTGERKLRETFEHHTLTGNGLCPEHQKLNDEGYVALVEIDPTKPEIRGAVVKPEDGYRTGRIAHVRRAVYEKLFNVQLTAKQPMAFCDPEVMAYLERIQAPEPEGV